MSGIVVGIDGSENSLEALRWAVQDAQRRATTVTAIHVYPPKRERSPHLAALSFVTAEATVQRVAEDDRAWREERSSEARRSAERMLSDMVRHAVPDPKVTIHQVAVEDDRPARVLIDRSASADLLVVGARGRGGFGGLKLGSVSQQVTVHAKCPVMIVRNSSRKKEKKDKDK